MVTTVEEDRNKIHTEDVYQGFSWLEDRLERLEAKEAWEEFQKRCLIRPEYHKLLASLMA